MPIEPTVQLREILKNTDDKGLEAFLHGYTVGSASELFVSLMVQPGQRTAFFVAIAKEYPNDWEAAVKELGK